MQVVSTNLTGSLLASRAALQLMAGQQGGGAVFMMEGAGSDGRGTPNVRPRGWLGRQAGLERGPLLTLAPSCP